MGKLYSIVPTCQLKDIVFIAARSAFLISFTDRRMNRRHGLERSCERMKKKETIVLPFLPFIVKLWPTAKNSNGKTSRASQRFFPHSIFLPHFLLVGTSKRGLGHISKAAFRNIVRNYHWLERVHLDSFASFVALEGKNFVYSSLLQRARENVSHFLTPRGVFFTGEGGKPFFCLFLFFSRGSCWLLDGAFFIRKVSQSPCWQHYLIYN